MSNLNSRQVVRLLKQEKGNYLKHYFSGGSVYNDEGDDIGSVSQKVIDNLVKMGKIKHVGFSEEFWSDGYYRLVV